MKQKVAIITCYKKPNYIRAVVLRRAVEALPDTKTIIVKNRYIGMLQYFEVIFKLIKVRIWYRPDTYLVTFRGYEILPFVRLICIGKPIIFDEFINPIEWLIYEHKKVKQDGLVMNLLKNMYGLFLKGTDVILADTESHAVFSAKIQKLPLQQYKAIPVGTDEEVFKPSSIKKKETTKVFKVFYYGSMLPLHGINHVCNAAIQLAKEDKNIQFTLIGGDISTKELINDAKQAGANIIHKEWVDFERLPDYIHGSDVCLGGPFGDTVQSRMVITGKTYQFLASAKPAIIGQVGGKTKLKDKVNCLLVKQGSSSDLVRAIIWAKNNPGELRNIAKNGRGLFEQNYSIKQITQLLKEVV